MCYGKKKKSTEKTDVFDYLFSGEHVHLSRPRAGMSLSIQSDLISMSTQEFNFKILDIFLYLKKLQILLKKINHVLSGRHFLQH